MYREVDILRVLNYPQLFEFIHLRQRKDFYFLLLLCVYYTNKKQRENLLL